MPLIKIEYTLPEGADKNDIAEFVVDALEHWGGQFHPDHPLFGSLRGHMTRLVINHKNFTDLLAKAE